MSLLNILLITTSAFFHATWNLICKKDNIGTVSMLKGNTLGVLLFSPILLLYPSIISHFSMQVWFILSVGGFFAGLYMFSLSLAYRYSDMSSVYPIVRSLPVILVTMILLIWKQESFSVYYLFGSGIVVLGLFISHPRGQKVKGIPANTLFTATVGYALLSAIGVAFYSIANDEALRILADLDSFSVVSTPIIYMILHGISVSVWLSIFICINKSERNNALDAIGEKWKDAFLMGIGIYVGYGLLLIAMVFATNVGYIVVFRQISIPIGVLLSRFILKEKVTAVMMIGTFIILGGLLIVGID